MVIYSVKVKGSAQCLYPYWQILENLSRNFPGISVLRVSGSVLRHADQRYFWKKRTVADHGPRKIWKRGPQLPEPDCLTEKLIQFYFEISISRSWVRPFYWKNHPCEFHEHLFSFCKISDEKIDCLIGKLIHICVTPSNLWNFISRLNALFRICFPVIRSGLCPDFE